MSDINRSSAWVHFTQPTEDGLHLNFWDAPYAKINKLPITSNFVIDAATEADPFGIAAEYLGDPSYYWVVLMYNGLSDAVHDLRPGMRIVLPSQGDLVNLLKSSNIAPNRGYRDRIIL